jgi:cytochrome b subunit of formate dehydrogenase
MYIYIYVCVSIYVYVYVCVCVCVSIYVHYERCIGSVLKKRKASQWKRACGCN